MSNIISMNNYTPKTNDSLLMDTNILIDLFYPTNFESYNSNPIESLYYKLCASKSVLLLSSVQLSEFINRCIRIQFNLYKGGMTSPELDFKKDYRCTEDYQEKMNGILEIIKTDILPSFKLIDDGFSKMPTDKIFLSGCSYDFNDALIFQIAKQYNAFIVTNDKDFFAYGKDIKIVTSNKFLLKFH